MRNKTARVARVGCAEERSASIKSCAGMITLGYRKTKFQNLKL